MPEAMWRKSSFSGNSGCVEVAIEHQYVRVRDSKDSQEPALLFNRAEWTAFLAGVRNGEFDLDLEGGSL